MRVWIKKRFHSFDMLFEYGRAVRLHFLDVFWGVGVGAGLPYLIYGIYSVFKTPPPIINWMAIVGALFLAGYYLWRADHLRLIPQLRIVGTRFADMPVKLNEHLNDLRTFCQLVPKCLSESPVYECVGHLIEVKRWAIDHWENTDFGPQILRWSHSSENSIVLHPGSENMLNVFFVRYSDHQLVPYVDADITWLKIYDTFRRQPGGVEAYQFEISVSCSQRVGGNYESIGAARVCLEVQVGNDPLHPHVELVQR